MAPGSRNRAGCGAHPGCARLRQPVCARWRPYARCTGPRGWTRSAQDTRHGLRVIRRSPAFSLAAVATLAVGIGASTAVFSVVDLLLFRSLPYPRADRLVSVGFSGPIDTSEFNVGNAYLDWRDAPARV
jgi:hypothetical protein